MTSSSSHYSCGGGSGSGEVLTPYVDQDYKIVSIKDLLVNNNGNSSGLLLPKFQRLLNASRVDDIYKNLLKETKNFTENPVLPGCLVVCYTKNQEWLVDGNHRYNVYCKIYKNHNINLKILINYIKVGDINEAENIFQKVNKSVPLPEMPKGTSISKVKEVTNYFVKKYPKSFSKLSSIRSNRPNLHFNEFQENLALVTKFRSDLESKEIIRVLECYNGILSKKTWKVFKTNKKTDTQEKIENWISKCNDSGCYLGMFCSYVWLFKIFEIPLKKILQEKEKNNSEIDDDDKKDNKKQENKEDKKDIELQNI